MHATDRVLQMRPCGFDPAGSGQILVVLSADSQQLLVGSLGVQKCQVLMAVWCVGWSS